jgi:hypothetical protein
VSFKKVLNQKTTAKKTVGAMAQTLVPTSAEHNGPFAIARLHMLAILCLVMTKKKMSSYACVLCV